MTFDTYGIIIIKKVTYSIYPFKRPGGDAFFKKRRGGAIIKDKKQQLPSPVVMGQCAKMDNYSKGYCGSDFFFRFHVWYLIKHENQILSIL